MHPSSSIIAFSTLSGAGYGLLAWLGLLAPIHFVPDDATFGAVAVGVALALVTAGLASSTAHLGHPERAWRAVSQWRTSWLSREGVAALATYVPAGLFALAWLARGDAGGVVTAWFGLLAAAGAVGTVVCTAMIYASLKPIRQWHNRFVPPIYLLFAGFSGAAILAVVAAVFSADAASLAAAVAAVFGVAAWAVTLAYWRFIDGAPATSTAETATGLGRFGAVRLLEAPHTEENFLLREMGFRIARKHRVGLRRIALGLAAAAIVLFASAALFGGLAANVLAVAAAIPTLLGTVIGRWLFFAEATHTVVLYYGRAA